MCLQITRSLCLAILLAAPLASQADTTAAPDPAPAPAPAATPASAAVLLTSVKDLLSRGYEVKNVVFIPDSALKVFQATVDTASVLITLQAGTSLAVCQMNGLNWDNQAQKSMEAPNLCSVYGPLATLH